MNESNEVSPRESDAERKASWSVQGLWPRTFGQFVQVGIGLAAVIASVRLTAIAEGSPQLAGAILASSGYFAPLASLLFSLIPVFVFLAALNLWEYWRFARRAGVSNVATRWAPVVIGLAWLVLLFIAPWVFAVGLPAAILVTYVLSRLLFGRHWGDEQESRYRPNPLREIVTNALIVVFTLLLLVLSDSRPWLPKEVLETQDESYVGYLLNIDSGWATILVDDPRYLQFVREEQLVSRTQCQIEHSPSAADFLGSKRPSETPLPNCDD